MQNKTQADGVLGFWGKSMTYLDEYHWFLDNLKTLQTMLEIKVYKKNKVDLKVAQ